MDFLLSNDQRSTWFSIQIGECRGGGFKAPYYKYKNQDTFTA